MIHVNVVETDINVDDYDIYEDEHELDARKNYGDTVEPDIDVNDDEEFNGLKFYYVSKNYDIAY